MQEIVENRAQDFALLTLGSPSRHRHQDFQNPKSMERGLMEFHAHDRPKLVETNN